jgi:hypothetical protein
VENSLFLTWGINSFFSRDYIHLNLKDLFSNYLCFVFSVFRNAYLQFYHLIGTEPIELNSMYFCYAMGE